MVADVESKKNVLLQQLRRSIISGNLKPGQIVKEEELAKEYGVSRTPVREALMVLAHDGLVNALPRTGHMITAPSMQDVQETYYLRELLEVESVKLAIGKISEDDLDMLAALKISPDIEVNLRANRTFHLTIARASGNRRFVELIERLIDDMERILVLDPNLGHPPDEWREHMAILTALRNKERRKVQKLMHEHIRSSRARILERF